MESDESKRSRPQTAPILSHRGPVRQDWENDPKKRCPVPSGTITTFGSLSRGAFSSTSNHLSSFPGGQTPSFLRYKRRLSGDAQRPIGPTARVGRVSPRPLDQRQSGDFNPRKIIGFGRLSHWALAG